MIGFFLKTPLIAVPFVGEKNYEQVDLPEIHNIGKTTISDSTVQKLTMTGPVKTERSRFGAVSIMGPAYFQKSTANRMRVIGATQTDNSRFKELSITGLLVSQESQSESLEVTGFCILEKSTFTKASIQGNAKISKSTINEMTIKLTHAQKPEPLEFTDTKIKELVIESSEEKSPPVIVLAGHTKINKIYFTAGNGRVLIKDNSVVVAQIDGGSLEKAF